MKELEEFELVFTNALLLGVFRNRKGAAWARFKCAWEKSAARALGWKPPMGTDDIVKRDTVKAVRLVAEQSDQEISTVRRPGSADIVSIGAFRLSRRMTGLDQYETWVYLTAHIKPECVDALGKLEPFITMTLKPGTLTIHYLAPKKAPVQTDLPGVSNPAHVDVASHSGSPEATAKRTHPGVADEMETRKAAVR